MVWWVGVLILSVESWKRKLLAIAIQYIPLRMTFTLLTIDWGNSRDSQILLIAFQSGRDSQILLLAFQRGKRTNLM